MYIPKAPRVIIPTGVGINSEAELKRAFEMAGARVDLRHINDLIANPNLMDDYNGAGLAGGFSMADYLGAGKSVANRVEHSGLKEKLTSKVNDPNYPMYIVCNALQILAKLDLFPVEVGTAANDRGMHMTNCWDMAVNQRCNTVWLKSLKEYAANGGDIFAPISHGEGRIYVPEHALAATMESNIIALTYVFGAMCKRFMTARGDAYNPNGSTADIAGFGWANNLVLFPHFERLLYNFQRPDRQELIDAGVSLRAPNPTTQMIFRDAVEYMRRN